MSNLCCAAPCLVLFVKGVAFDVWFIFSEVSETMMCVLVLISCSCSRFFGVQSADGLLFRCGADMLRGC